MYVDVAEPWIGILAAEAFSVRSTYHLTKQKNPGQLFLGQDIILPINNMANWRHIHQRKQRQIEKDVIRENSTRIDYNFNIGDKVVVIKNRLINEKYRSKVRMKLFKCGQTEPLLYEQVR